MRTVFYGVLFCITVTTLHAQDTLYKADGSILPVKIVDAKSGQVKYRLFASPEGPTYVIGADYILRIIYESGRIEVYHDKAPEAILPVAKLDPLTTDFGRNFIAVDVFDLATGALTIGYEFIFKSGLSSIRVPLSIGVFDRGSYAERKVFGTGLDYNFYPTGQGKFRFFFGPSLEYKRFEFSYSAGELNSSYAFLAQTGVLLQASKHFNLSFTLGYGYARIIENTSFNNLSYGEVAFRAGLNAGYKF